MPIVTADCAWEYHRGRKTHAGLVIAVVMLVVFYISAGLIWTVVSADWGLSFLTTLEASVNSAKYGHPVEHRAETMVAWLLMLSTLAALVAGAVAAVVDAEIRRRHPERNSALTDNQ
jgi:pheromone shutdown protein TraB